MQKEKFEGNEGERNKQLEKVLTKCIKSHQRVSFKEENSHSEDKVQDQLNQDKKQN